MTEFLVRWADAVPWWLWTISAMLGIMGTFSLAVKGYHRAALGVGH